MLSSADQIRVNEINDPFTALKAASATIDDETHICIHVYTRIYVCPFDETRQSFANLIRTSDRVTGVEPFPEKIVSDCRLTRLIDNLNPLSSLIRPSNTLTSKRERSPYRIHTRFAFYEYTRECIPSVVIFVYSSSFLTYFRFIYLTKLLAPFTDWTYDRIYYATCFSIRPLSAISSQFTLDLVIRNEKSDRVSFFSFSLTPSPRIVHSKEERSNERRLIL